MALFRITKEVHERATPASPGWQHLGLHKIEDGETTLKNGHKIPKTMFSFKILDGKDAGKFATRTVLHDYKNEKEGWEENFLHYHLEFLEFMAGKKLNGREADFNLTMENAVKQLDGFVENNDVNGIIMSNVTRVRPLTKK